MSRALQQARREATERKDESRRTAQDAAAGASRPRAERDAGAGTKEPVRADVREPSSPDRNEGRPATEARERDDTDAGTDTGTDAQAPSPASASAEGASSAIPPSATGPSPHTEANAPADGDADSEAAGAAQTSPSAAAQYGAPLASLGAAAATADEPGGTPLATTTKTAQPNAHATADVADASSTGTDDADATPADADASLDSTEASSSTASRPDAATPRAAPDFATQLAHARIASTSDAARFEPARTASAPPAPGPTPHAGALATPLHAPAFPAHFAAEVAMLGAAGIERAEIQMQPPELGPVRIELSLSGESARVAFTAAQPETRQAIEQSLPILKDLLAERGLTLGDTSVSHGDARADGGANGYGQATTETGAARTGAGARTDERSTAHDERRMALRRSLLDVYA
ncbi:MAG TPA: flagellar hook-length control protein FliK [Zeimonas sp.]